MSEANKAKLAAARRLLREHQKKKGSASTNTVDHNSQQSSLKSNSSSERGSNIGNGQESHHNSGPPSASSSPSYAFPNNVQRVNGSFGSAFPQDLPTDPGAAFFDSIPPPSRIYSDDGSFKLPVIPPMYNSIVTADRTDSSCSISTTKSDDDSVQRLRGLECQLALEIERKEELESRFSKTNETVKCLEREVNRLQEMVDHLSKNGRPEKEEMNVQLRTIEILVSEKSELQQELSSVSDENKRNADKVVEYSVKMKALKTEVARLQDEARDNNEARAQHNSILRKLEQSLNEANDLTTQYRRDIDINQEEIQELKRIIHENCEINDVLNKNLEEANRKLSLAEMKIAQTGGNLDEPQSTLNFERECEQLRGEVTRMRKEVAENTSQYKDYIETLDAQLQLVTAQYETCQKEKNELLSRQEGLVKQLSDLEKQMAKDRKTGPSLTQSNLQLNEQLTAAFKSLEETELLLKDKTVRHDALVDELNSTKAKLQETELALERLEVPNAQLLQAAMESDRIAASRAIEQNVSLKSQLTELSSEMNHSIVKLNNEKLDLTEKLQYAEHLVKELNGKLSKHKHKESAVYTDAVAQCPMIFQADHTTQTDIDDLEIFDPEHVSPEAARLLEAKLKRTMKQVADLSDENQKLEHLVLQLQGETETICEYVTLYQNQRGLLREKVMERERQLGLLAKERKEFKDKLSQINHLLPQVSSAGDSPHMNAVNEEDAASKIKILLTEIESSSLVQDKIEGTPNTFHPCLLCSGKLITV